MVGIAGGTFREENKVLGYLTLRSDQGDWGRVRVAHGDPIESMYKSWSLPHAEAYHWASTGPSFHSCRVEVSAFKPMVNVPREASWDR